MDAALCSSSLASKCCAHHHLQPRSPCCTRALPTASSSTSSPASTMSSAVKTGGPAFPLGSQHLPSRPLAPSSSPAAPPRSQGMPSRSSRGGQEVIQGYTPANYISYSDRPEHACRHLVGVSVQAPVAVCFDLWNDWARLVDFLDLISQIGLDPDEPDMGLFQCFYRWGRMPVMEIVFLARKSYVEEDRLIQFETVWGLPAKGEVEFIEDGPNTTVLFRFEHQMPVLLVELKVGALSMETHLRKIFAENMEDFKQLAEMIAQEPGQAPPRRTAEHKKAVGTSGAPRATPPGPEEERPWQQQQQQPQAEASTSGAAAERAVESDEAPSTSGRQPRMSPPPRSLEGQQLDSQQAATSGLQGVGARADAAPAEEVQKRRGRPKSRKLSGSATPPPAQPEGSHGHSGAGGGVNAGGVSERQGVEVGGNGGAPSWHDRWATGGAAQSSRARGSRSSSVETEGGDSSSNNGVVGPGGRRSRTRSSSPSAAASVMGQPSSAPPAASSKGRRSRSATQKQ